MTNLKFKCQSLMLQSSRRQLEIIARVVSGLYVLLRAIDEGFLLKLPFTTIFEYLQLLKMVATSINCFGQHGMFYLAAAVSDFYVPWETMVATDRTILLRKAEMALKNYGMHVVVANELANYKDVVVMVTKSGKMTVRRHNKDEDLEEQLIDLLVKMHSDYMMKPNVE